ncbi:hypothetical protein ALO52_200168 [Pseudomonas syringae pv. primulae]|uniref:Acyltransferase 3 domain-containing protein n=1 Tax=Pseudomonas syringae pv. primulae TaxID=251707 RepID=A0A0Q0AR97_9PSED|nr:MULTISPECIES: acyltransferase [Pseudomonas syringae group]KPY36459.1 hypothetical protein ALO52_200168 [Pseudomonas syringae pv. primulae]TKJ68087.1 acyltransferase [Pseudomonas viridiflava]TKK28577.1 acyltransferase [Pseudomonas viridiflava]
MTYNLHSKTIDALRGVAAAAVFFSHSDASRLATNEWLTANRGVLGSVGVYMFFCLSGYLIWRSGLRLIGLPGGLRLYAIHRITRLMPLYLVNLFVVLALIGYVGSKWVPSHDAWVVLRHLVLSQDLYPYVSREINPVLWTLTHEALFYAVAAVLLMANIRNTALILVASLVLYALCLALGVVDYFKFSKVLYAFALGVFIAEGGHSRRVGICLMTVLLAVYSFVDDSFSEYMPALIGVALTLVFLSLSLDRKCSRLTSVLMSPIVFLGVISYSLYIWHYQVIHIMEYHIGFFDRVVPGWAEYQIIRAVVTVTICVAIAWLSYVMIEKPSMGRLREAVERSTGLTPVLAH